MMTMHLAVHLPDEKKVDNEDPTPRAGLLRHTPGRDSMPYAARRASIDAEVERLTSLGASTAYVNAPEGADYYAVTMRDPEGNEFCVA
jgi:hypothetical protein